MCRWTYYLGPKITLSSLLIEPAHSLINQSFQARERDEPLNGDGFGVAYYVPHLSERAAVFRSISPAWGNSNLRSLAPVTESSCILAHVRAATQGLSVIETNCHPFTSGSLTMAHNGDIGGFGVLRRFILHELSDQAFHAIRGTTDSEHLFALVLDQYHRDDAPADPVERLEDALRRAVGKLLEISRAHGIQEHSYLNVALTDGRCGVVMRFTTDAPEHADSLYVHTGRRYVCEDGVCHMIDPTGSEKTVICSSEPLSGDDGWQPIPVNHFVVIDPDRRTAIRAF